MAELVSEMNDYQDTLRMRVRTKDALGNWTWLIDGETGRPVEANVSNDWLADQHNPRFAMEAIGNHMEKITRSASVLEFRSLR